MFHSIYLNSTSYFTLGGINLFLRSYVNYLKTEINLIGPYDAANTSSLLFKRQSINVVQGSDLTCWWEWHYKRKYTAWAERRLRCESWWYR
jgi:hypothetical protein